MQLSDKIMDQFTKFSKASLQRKITVYFILLITVVLLVVTFIAYNVSANITIEQTIKNTDQNLELVIEKIDFMRNELKTYSKIIITNEEIQALTNKVTMDFNQRKRVERLLYTNLEPRTFIDAAIIYNMYGNTFVPTNIILKDPLSVDELDEIKRRLEGRYNGLSTNTRSSYYYRDNKNRDIISFYYKMNSFSGKRTGILELSILEQFLSELYKTIKIGDTGEIYIVDEDGKIISNRDKNKINSYITHLENYSELLTNDQEVKILTLNHKKTLILNKRYDPLGWHVIGIVAVEELIKKSKLQSLIIIFSGLLCTLFSAIVITRVSKSISNPIMKLSKIVEKTVPGEIDKLDQFDMTHCSYEVSMLAQEFISLNKKTAVFMDEIKEAQRLEKEHALNMLQLQMNPHFLYNTLETVCGLIDLEFHNEAIDLVNKIAAFYRGVLSKGQTVVTIAEDLHIVRCYLDIINVRYNNKLNFEVDIEEPILTQAIVKLTLQPLIENAIVHGLIGKKSDWSIHLSGIVEEHKIVITINDNGMGMSKELFCDIMNAETPSKGGSFALKGTDERIKLQFGTEYGLELDDAYKGGTQIRIRLPIIEVK